MTKVSVITTVYNGERYFDRAVPGILGQTHKEFEWIIINDGSTDRTQELLEDLATKDPRIRVFNFGRLGRANALNKAIELAQGEYLVQQDFDDISYSARIEKQVSFLENHTEIGVVGSWYVLVDENRGERYIRKPPTEHEQIVKAMAKYIPFAHTLVTFRKSAGAQAGGYPDMKDIEDLRFWIKIAKAGWRLANLPEVLGEHFVYKQSYWHQHFKYAARQRELAKVQWRAICELNLPFWMTIYPLGRFVYPYLPKPVKKFARRVLIRSREEDIKCQ